MIIKGAARGNAKWLATHLHRTDTNEVAELVEIRGLVAQTTLGALREIAATAVCTKARDPLYHANIDPRATEKLTPEQWARAIDLLAEKLGFTDQPRVVVRHVKEGREHYHVVWSRIDIDNRRAIPEWQNYPKHEAVARQLEREFGHERVQGPLAEREGVPRPPRGPSRAEMQQAERSGLDPKAIKAEVSGLWQQTDNGKAFAAALDEAGYCLARGDRRDFVIIDQAGEVHSLARRVEGAKAADIRARMADLDPASLPDAGQAKAIQAGRTAAEPAARSEPVTIEAEAAAGKAARPKRIRTRAKAGRDAAEDVGPDQALQAEPSPAAPAEPVPVVQQSNRPEAITPDAGGIDQPGRDEAEAMPVAATVPQAEPPPAGPVEPVPVPQQIDQLARDEAESVPAADPVPEAEPSPAAPAEPPAPVPVPEPEPAEPPAPAGSLSFVKSATAALAAQRRQLLDVLRRVWERRAEMLSARTVEEQAPAPVEPPPPVLPEPDPAAAKRQQLLDALQLGRERARQGGPEAAPLTEAAPPAPIVPTPPEIEAPPVAAVPLPDVPAVPASDRAAQRQQAARALAEDQERRRRDPRISQEEAQLATQQARRAAAERKALETKHGTEWKRLERTEATRAQRDRIEDAQAAQVTPAKPRGWIARLKAVVSPAAREEQERIEAQRLQEHAERVAERRARDAEARAALTAAQARERDTAERASAARAARELEELRQRQRDREAREREREEERDRDGRGGRGGRDGLER